MKFMECDNCRIRPGSPQLCQSCLINRKTIEDLESSKKNAYWERNQLVAALSRIYPSVLGRHSEFDKEWEDDWRWIVYITIPTKELEQKMIQGGFFVNHKRQMSWHIHDSDLDDFYHLKRDLNIVWDGHTTEEKYERLKSIRKPSWF